MNMLGIFGMKAGIDLLLEIGIDRVADRILMNQFASGRRLQRLGFKILGPVTGPNASGIYNRLGFRARICRPFLSG